MLGFADEGTPRGVWGGATVTRCAGPRLGLRGAQPLLSGTPPKASRRFCGARLPSELRRGAKRAAGCCAPPHERRRITGPSENDLAKLRAPVRGSTDIRLDNCSTDGPKIGKGELQLDRATNFFSGEFSTTSNREMGGTLWARAAATPASWEPSIDK